ncbi:hypothetical protein E2C01_077512 [Portunus trituberculatus]|uniref:Uncharacterized protein n=1 Tax=Portunus trituberculatus TaxID=210409 RepID=A0A5B7IMH6_PORTR|nr:hypothetical protein [Portunus trituberculatus]
MSQVRRYGLKMSPFRTCYFRTFENFFLTSDLRTSFAGPQVRRSGGADRGTEVPSSAAYPWRMVVVREQSVSEKGTWFNIRKYATPQYTPHTTMIFSPTLT